MKEKLNQIALPLMLNNVLALFIGLCDQAMIGHVSLTGFASVGIVAGIINSVTGILGATSVSFNILGARAKGDQDQRALVSSYHYHMIQSIMIGIISIGLVGCLGRIFLQHFYQLQGEVLQEAMNYAVIFSASIGLNLMIFMGSSYLKIINETKYVLIGNLTAALCNVVFDYILIFGHFGFQRLGIVGNAMGSILALIVNLIIYSIIIKKSKPIQFIKISQKQIRESFKLSLPLMGQEFLEGTLMILAIGMLVARIGLLEVAVYQLLVTLVEIAFMPIYGYGQAALTLISEGIEHHSKIVGLAIKQSFIFYSLMAVGLIIGSPLMLKLIIDDVSVIQLAYRYLPLVMAVTLLNIPSTIYKYGLQSIGKETDTFRITCLGSILSLLFILINFLFNQNLVVIYLGFGVNYGYLLYRFNLKLQA